MENENTDRTLQIALGSYDRKELRVQKNYIQEQCAGSECTCFQNGSRLLEQLQQGRRFDAVILCSQLEDMSGLELLTELRTTEARPPVLMIDEARRQNSSILCPESGEGLCYVGRTELRSLLWELYRMPGRQNRQMERRCQELYEGWGIRQPDMNSRYLSSAVGVVYGTIQKLAIRKEILQAVGEQYEVSVSAVDSGIRRMVDQLEARPTAEWLAFKEKSGFTAGAAECGADAGLWRLDVLPCDGRLQRCRAAVPASALQCAACLRHRRQSAADAAPVRELLEADRAG